MSREQAEEEFQQFMQLMDLDHKLNEKMDDEDAKSLRKCISSITKALEDGSLVIDMSSGEAVFTPRRGDHKPIKFGEPNAGVLLAADKRREGHLTAKTLAILAEWSGENAVRFSSLKPVDYEVCTSLFGLFFG